ncbi:sigma-70 family RNA polymerase sigma factor [Sphingobacterium sp. N143]|uniref:RNA polymerase sigma factor n=1 Tax=Sphingobacterium sp. N143 TaxID=2746727 RepID=UPI002576DF55|nr:sigma-70 family RNA polymerase sigma factor [Sphingobacterium sp. N143]MDM1295622.1 sigma-70 family RNA polymerase sigma factor [Sphingobacterium sp. N143]
MNQEQFKNTVFIHKDKLFRFAKRILVDEEEAFDAVQDVMMRLWQGKDRLHLYSNLEAFCMQSIKNEALNRIKKDKIRADFVQQHQVVPLIESKIGNTKEIIVEMISSLPEKQRLVMHLRDVEDYDIDEIGQVLEMGESAVRVNLMRARQKVREQLTKLFDYEGQKIKGIGR